MEECRVILAEQDNILTFSELQDRCHLGLLLIAGLVSSWPSSVDRDNLLTFSELHDRCHLGLHLLIRLRHLFFPDLEDGRVPSYLSRAG
ncbi:hypothetical protein GQ457_18G012710 [Hibiscus cannabinus]